MSTTLTGVPRRLSRRGRRRSLPAVALLPAPPSAGTDHDGPGHRRMDVALEVVRARLQRWDRRTSASPARGTAPLERGLGQRVVAVDREVVRDAGVLVLEREGRRGAGRELDLRPCRTPAPSATTAGRHRRRRTAAAPRSRTRSSRSSWSGAPRRGRRRTLPPAVGTARAVGRASDGSPEKSCVASACRPGPRRRSRRCAGRRGPGCRSRARSARPPATETASARSPWPRRPRAPRASRPAARRPPPRPLPIATIAIPPVSIAMPATTPIIENERAARPPLARRDDVATTMIADGHDQRDRGRGAWP